MENKFHGQGKYIWEHGAYYIGAWYSPAPCVCIHLCVLVLACMLLMCNWLNYMRILIELYGHIDACVFPFGLDCAFIFP